MNKIYCVIDINGNMIAKSKDKQKLERLIEEKRNKAEKSGTMYQFKHNDYAIVNY